MTTFRFNQLKDKIIDQSCKIVVVGAGYVGYELCAGLSSVGYKVSALETNSDRIAQLREKFDKEEYELVKFHVSSDPTMIKFADVVIICVPTPLSKSRLRPDMSFIDKSISTIKDFDIKGKLFILESTTSPFTTIDRILPKLRKGTGMDIGEDFWLGFSPERIDPANTKYNITNTTKIVSGVSKRCIDLISQLYIKLTKIKKVSNTQTAEMVKLYENTFRNVNIALVCELAQYCRENGIDVSEVIESADTKEFGFMKFYPSLIGGHCLPIDPYYLTYHANKNNRRLHLTETALAIHESMPKHVLKIIEDAVGGSLSGKHILIIGVAYKPNVSDCRESGAMDLYKLLRKKSAVVSYHDSHVPSMIFYEASGREKTLQSVDFNIENVSNADCVVLLQKHDNFDSLEDLFIDAKAIVDLTDSYPKTDFYFPKKSNFIWDIPSPHRRIFTL
jgi:UDP-N-acetyl-D-glucosamine dehydrogenase